MININKIPITNPHLFEIKEYKSVVDLGSLTNHEAFFTLLDCGDLGYITKHRYIANNDAEGIHLRWDGNVFDLPENKFTDVIREL